MTDSLLFQPKLDIVLRQSRSVISPTVSLGNDTLLPDADKISQAIRSHWLVENALHWVLDVTFKEDDSRIRRGLAAENMAVMRRLPLNLIRNETASSYSVPRKRRKANLYDEYRDKLIAC